MSEQDIVASRTILSILILTNVVGNSLVILVIIRNRSMKTPMNYLLLNLAVADLTAGVFYIPHSILKEERTSIGPVMGGAVVCRLVTSGYLTWTSLLSSVSCLVFIAVDRYYAIMKPFSTRHRITNKKLKVFIPISWTVCATVCIITIHSREFDGEKRVCIQKRQALITRIYLLLWALITGAIPASVMLVLYSRVIRRLWFEKDTDSVTLQAVRRSRKKITKTMLILSAVYVLCWVPDYIHHLLEVFFPDISVSPILSNLFHWSVLLNSSVNPIIYAFQFENFRRELRKIFCCVGRDSRIHVTPRTRGQNSVMNDRTC